MNDSDSEYANGQNGQSVYANTKSNDNSNDNSNDQQVSRSSTNQQVSNDDYQNLPELNQSCDNSFNSVDNLLNNSKSSTEKTTPPQPKPRLSLLNKKPKEERSSYELNYQKRLDKIDENLNLIIQTHKEKFKHTDDILDDINNLNNDNDKDHYLSNDLLPSNSLFKNKRTSELNRNTYISNSDVNEDTSINNRISNTYNELEEDPIYSDILFPDKPQRQSKPESVYYDTISPVSFNNRQNNQNGQNDDQVITPPPLPPRRRPDDNRSDANFKPKPGPKNHLSLNKHQFNDLNDSLDTSNDTRTATDVVHHLLRTIRNQEDLQNNMHLFSSENLKPIYDQEKKWQAMEKKLLSSNNTNGYGKINKIEQSRKDLSDDEGSLQSSYSLMNSQINSSSNDSFLYKSANSNQSHKSNHKKGNKPTVNVVSPFSVRYSSTNSSSTDLDNKQSQKLFNNKFSNEQHYYSINPDNQNRTMETSFMNKFSDETHYYCVNPTKPSKPTIDTSKLSSSEKKFLKQSNEPKQESINEVSDDNGQFSHDNQNNVREYLYLYNRKQFQKRWFDLSSSHFFYYPSNVQGDKMSVAELKDQKTKGHIVLDEVTFINSLAEPICLNTNRLQQAIKSIKRIIGIELYQFHIGTNTENGRLYLLGAESQNRRRDWIDLLAYKIRPKLKQSDIEYKDVDTCGYLHIKIGLTGIWSKCWCVMRKRTMKIVMMDMGSEDKMQIDLRQVMTIGYCNNFTDLLKPVNEGGQPFFLNRRHESVLYFQADHKGHTEQWFNSIENNWKLPDNGLFEDQLLSPSKIPIAVEKCINFISSYDGRNTYRIYKASGDETYSKCILENLKSNTVFEYHLRPEDGYTVLDCADALKLYLTSFSECILTENLYIDFLKLTFIDLRFERILKIKALLKKLPAVNFKTLEKLLCHFTLIIENSEVNGMDLDALASALAPSLIFSKIGAQPPINRSVSLLKDLINSFLFLFELEPSELEKERKIEKSLVELRKYKVGETKQSFMVVVYLFNRDWNYIMLNANSNTTVDDVLNYACLKANIKEDLCKLCICEIVADKQLERVLHYSEKVRDVVLNWPAKWSQEDAKGNHLILKTNTLYEELDDYFKAQNQIENTCFSRTLFSEVKFSEEGRNFKKVFLEFANSKFNVYKDAKASKSLASWSLKEYIYYVGHERKRNPPTSFCLTLLDKDNKIQRQKEMIVCKLIVFESLDELGKWFSTIISNLHPQGIYPLISGLNNNN